MYAHGYCNFRLVKILFRLIMLLFWFFDWNNLIWLKIIILNSHLKGDLSYPLKVKLKQCTTCLLMIVAERNDAYIMMQRTQFLFRQLLLKLTTSLESMTSSMPIMTKFISLYSPLPLLCGLGQSFYNQGTFSCSSVWLPLSCDVGSKILWLILIHQPKVS